MSTPISTTVIDDGPIKISGAESLTYCGEPVQADGDVYLCRCGNSANAPFCDGTHKREGFSGTNRREAKKAIKSWEGQGLRTFFNPNACMHAAYCKPLTDLRAKELDGDAGAAAEIMRVIDTCPSGALTYQTKGQAPDQARSAGPATEIMEGGEVRVHGEYSVNVAALERQPGDRATLCRCGRSENKPWCDGRHKSKTDFR